METMFLAGVQFVSDNRFWIMPIACVAMWIMAIREIRSAFRGLK